MILSEKKYSINNFVIHELVNEDSLVILNTRGIVKIKEHRLAKLIRDWDGNSLSHVFEDTLKKVFSEDFENALKFMLNNSILEEEKQVNFLVEKIMYISNNEKLNEFMKSVYSDELKLPKQIKFIDTESSVSHLCSEERCLYIIFLNPYNKRIAASIRDSIKINGSSLLMMSYVYNNNFYMDSLYFPSLYTPCHLCHIGHIESQLRVNTNGSISYQQIIDSIYLENPNFSIETPLSQNNILNIATITSNRVSKIILFENGLLVFPEELHECLMLDLQNNQVHRDYSLYWELCDCYEQ